MSFNEEGKMQLSLVLSQQEQAFGATVARKNFLLGRNLRQTSMNQVAMHSSLGSKLTMAPSAWQPETCWFVGEDTVSEMGV